VAAWGSMSIDKSTPTISAMGRAAATMNVTRPDPQASSNTLLCSSSAVLQPRLQVSAVARFYDH
jgi:hypothetical protein